MSIDSIKTKPKRKQEQSAVKNKMKLHKPQVGPKTKDTNRIKMWSYTAMAFVLIIGLWVVSLKVNIARISQTQTTNETTSELTNLKSKFNQLFGQTSQFIDRIDLNTTTSALITSETPTSTADELSDEQIKELSDSIKNIISTTTPE